MQQSVGFAKHGKRKRDIKCQGHHRSLDASHGTHNIGQRLHWLSEDPNWLQLKYLFFTLTLEPLYYPIIPWINDKIPPLCHHGYNNGNVLYNGKFKIIKKQFTYQAKGWKYRLRKTKASLISNQFLLFKSIRIKCNFLPTDKGNTNLTS